MSMAGASGDRWAIRTHPSWVAAGDVDAADAAGDVAETRTAVPPSSVAIVASLARCLKSLMIAYLSTWSRPPQRKRVSDDSCGCRAMLMDLEGRRQQSQRAGRGEFDVQCLLACVRMADRDMSGQERRVLLVHQGRLPGQPDSSRLSAGSDGRFAEEHLNAGRRVTERGNAEGVLG